MERIAPYPPSRTLQMESLGDLFCLLPSPQPTLSTAPSQNSTRNKHTSSMHMKYRIPDHVKPHDNITNYIIYYSHHITTNPTYTKMSHHIRSFIQPKENINAKGTRRMLILKHIKKHHIRTTSRITKHIINSSPGTQ